MVEVDSLGRIRFLGSYYSHEEKELNGRLNAKQLARLVRQVRSLPLDELKPSYEAGWSCAQACDIHIEYQGGVIKSCAFGFDRAPIALRIPTLITNEKYSPIIRKGIMVPRESQGGADIF
ncbi:hypothetical protein EDD80_1156 [Anseongella ginsenosidimutans]|uniref:DUF6438 domain-containing protein n=1 Tax=Anseongella ginsenosidimutans TaxID=496056 RepID=A0A4R3KLL5_9SPHI|nr:hypothetical protein EDD80_1156 [Anseongella ginsenosidimutans]